VTDTDVTTGPDAGAGVAAASAGALLRTAREAAGMSIDTVAQQLKLAPRQVNAIEDGDFTRLPGRTFVRGFIRNYARLVRLDPESVLAALPGTASTPTLDSPQLHATAPTIGELPTNEHSKPGWTRWAIPLTLVAIIAAAALYEFIHPAADIHRDGANVPASAPEASLSKTAPEIIGTPLPNPVAPVPGPSYVAMPDAMPGPVPAPTASIIVPAVTAAKPAIEAPPAAPAATAAAASSARAVADSPLTLAFRDFSWTEIKDRKGKLLLSGMNSGGTSQSLIGTPPLDVVIGNAADVTLTWKGKHVDLAPLTRQNVARFTLE
jgi:cytoskeleton protein RodZ